MATVARHFCGIGGDKHKRLDNAELWAETQTMDNENSEHTPSQNQNPESLTPPTPVVLGAANTPKKTGSSRRAIVIAVAALFVVASAVGGYAAHASTVNKHKTELAALRTQVADLQKTTYPLPASAMKVSDCIPSMGYHYLAKGADKEYGPFYLVNKQKQVIGLEYMAADAMYTNVPGSPVPIEILEKDSPGYGMKFDHVEFSHMPGGHEGLEADHIDLHMYTVDADVVKDACN